MASDLRVQAGMKLNLVTGGATLGEQTTYQGNTQYLDSDLTLIGQSLTDIDEDISYNFSDGTGFKTYRLKKSFVYLGNRPANTLITALNLATYFDLRSTSTGGGGGGTETDPVYLAEKDIDGTLSANSDSKVATQKAVKLYIDTAVARSTITNKTTLNGAIPVSNIKITPTVLTSANFPALTNDGDYYTFSATDVGVNKSYYTFPNTITYKVAVGDKIQFNKTDNDYLFYSAGQNQIASEVPATAIVASSTTIGVPGTNAQQQIADLATAIKNLGVTIPTKLARIAGDIYAGNDFYLEDPEIVIVPSGKTAIVDTLEYRVNSGTVNTGGNVFTVNAYTPAVYNTGTGTPATPVLLGNIGTVTIAPTTRAITVVLNPTVANRTFISSFQIAIVNQSNEFGIADHFGLLTTIK